MTQPQPESVDVKTGKDKVRGRVTGAQLRLMLQLALVVVLAYLIGERFTGVFHGTSASIGALWCALGGIAVFQATRKDTWDAGTRQVLGALIGAIVSGIYLSLLPFSPVGLGISVGVTVLVCQLAGFPESSKMAASAVVTIMVISSTSPTLSPALNAGLRFAEACIGAGIAIALTLLSPKPSSEVGPKQSP